MRKRIAGFFLCVLLVSSLAAMDLPESIDLSGEPVGIKVIEATNQGFTFYPSKIQVKKGDIVRLTYTNGGGFHDWVLDEFGAATRKISGGKVETIEFTADQEGVFEFYCSVGNHRKQGMFGQFIVVD